MDNNKKYFSIRLDEETFYKLRDIAKNDNRSLNGLLVHIFKKNIAEFEEKYGSISDTQKS